MDIFSYLLSQKGSGGTGNIDKYIEQGRQEEWSEFWDAYQVNGTLVNYNQAFFKNRWTKNNFKPKYSMYPVNAIEMFRESNINVDLSSLCSELKIALDFSKSNSIDYLFYSSKFIRIPEINLTSSTNNLLRTFGNMPNLVTIDKLILREDGSQKFSSTFDNSTVLENIVIEGTIGQNGFNVQWCPLTHDSLISIINALQDKTGVSGSWTVTIGPNNIAKLTSDELKIAENKGWVVV